MTSIFLSYSHKDQEYRDRLETHLSALMRQGLIDVWHDRRIKAGDEFDGVISESLEIADVILLLVSADFIASDYCFNVEMVRAMERHASGGARLIPIIIRHCDWHGMPFGKLLAPRDGQPISTAADMDEALLDVVRAIKEALPSEETAGAQTTPVAEAVSAPVQPSRPRSSNLGIPQQFSDADRDRFLEDAFGFIADFFEESLKELQARYDDIETSFRRIDANCFTGVIYRNGKARGRCCIVLGGAMGRGITYSSTDKPNTNSFNEILMVESDDQGIYLSAMMGHWSTGHNTKHIGVEAAAEHLWARLKEQVDPSS